MNPSAPVFVPSWMESEVDVKQEVDASGDTFCEKDVSPEELVELEAADDWVALQAQIEQEEQEHIKLFALMNAPASVDWDTVDWGMVEERKSSQSAATSPSTSPPN